MQAAAEGAGLTAPESVKPAEESDEDFRKRRQEEITAEHQKLPDTDYVAKAQEEYKNRNHGYVPDRDSDLMKTNAADMARKDNIFIDPSTGKFSSWIQTAADLAKQEVENRKSLQASSAEKAQQDAYDAAKIAVQKKKEAGESLSPQESKLLDLEEQKRIDAANEEAIKKGGVPRGGGTPFVYIRQMASTLLSSDDVPDKAILNNFSGVIENQLKLINQDEAFQKLPEEDKKARIHFLQSTAQQLRDIAELEASRPDDRGIIKQAWASTRRAAITLIPEVVADVGRTVGITTSEVSKNLGDKLIRAQAHIDRVGAWLDEKMGTQVARSNPSDVLEERPASPLETLGRKAQTTVAPAGEKVAEYAAGWKRDLDKEMATNPDLLPSKAQKNSAWSMDSITDNVVTGAANVGQMMLPGMIFARAAKVAGLTAEGVEAASKLGFLSYISSTTYSQTFNDAYDKLREKGLDSASAFQLASSEAAINASAQTGLMYVPFHQIGIPNVDAKWMGPTLDKAAKITGKELENLPAGFLKEGLKSYTTMTMASVAGTAVADVTKAIHGDSEIMNTIATEGGLSKTAAEKVAGEIAQNMIGSWLAFFLGGFSRGQVQRDVSEMSEGFLTAKDSIRDIMGQFGITDKRLLSRAPQSRLWLPSWEIWLNPLGFRSHWSMWLLTPDIKRI